MEERLRELRSRIDELDSILLRLLEERLRVCSEIGALKAELGTPLRDPVREEEVLSRVPQQLRPVFKAIIDSCVSVQEDAVTGAGRA